MIKKYLKWLAIPFICLLVFTIWFYWKNPLTAKVRINDQLFYVDVAATPAEKAKGLGGRKTLAPNHGMLFPYDHKEKYGFWMKDMQFPIDIIWIEGNIVAEVTHNVPVDSEPHKSYQPYVAVDKILELNAGEASKYNIKQGDKVKFIN